MLLNMSNTLNEFIVRDSGISFFFKDTTIDWISIGFIIFVILILVYFVYWLFYAPIDWTKDLTEVSFNFVRDRHNSRNYVSAINRVRRLRNPGEKLPPPFPNGWISIAESSSVKINQAIDVACLGQNFVVFRTEKNEVHVFDAYCPHLGAHLGIGGKVRGDCIECPFHEWTFRGSDGQCVNIPYATSGTIPKTAKLKKWTSVEVNNGIFIWHHAENMDPWELPVVKEIDTKQWVYHGRNEFSINCHIQEIPENGADVAHLAAVHGSFLLAGSDLRFTTAKWAAFGMHAWQAKWQPSNEINHIATMFLKHSMRILNKMEICSLDVSARQIGPAYVQLFMNSSFGSFVVLQTITPIEPLVQKCTHRFYGPRALAPFLKFTLCAESIMVERDIMVWNQKCYTDSPCLIKEDRTIKLYRTWYSQFYSENSQTFAQSKETMDW